MDQVERYRALIRHLFSELATLLNIQHASKDNNEPAQCVFDAERDQYVLLKVGWSGKRRIRGITLYVRLRNGKIWIEEDMTEDGIATDLVKAGVPKEDIVLAFQPPDVRRFTEFATV
jgi:hypothetical protein